MNKKAQFDIARKTMYWMIIGVVIVIVVLSFAMTMVSYKEKITYIPPELKANLISMRFTHNSDCFAYEEEGTSKVYPNIIDINKFNREIMNNCYQTEQEKGFKDYNFKLLLKSSGKELRSNNYFEEDDFTIIKKVYVKDNNDNFVEDTLLIYVQVY